MAWHLGYPLSQTLFTSLYLEGIVMPPPQNIDDAHFTRVPGDSCHGNPMLEVLRAYCLGLLKACWYVNERIKFEHYYEVSNSIHGSFCRFAKPRQEEDFVTNTYHRSLLDNIPIEEIRDKIQEARQLVNEMKNSLDPKLAEALDFRLEFRFAFLRAIELSELRSNPESLKTPWIHMKAILGRLKESHGQGIPVEECFSAKLQRRLASTMPPRPIVKLDFDEAHRHFLRLAVDGIEVADVLRYTDSQSLLVCSGTTTIHGSGYADIVAELHPVLPGKEATTIGLHSNSSAELCFQRHGSSRLIEHPPSF